MNILVVGGGGYIGIPTCEELVRRAHTVAAYDRWFFGKRPSSAVTQLWGDIRTIDPGDIQDRFDTVIDLSGLSNDASCEINPIVTQSINLDGAIRLAITAKQAGVKRYIYSSSCSVYGHGAHHDLKETDELHPLTLYAVCKAKVEDHLRSLEGDGFEVLILRNATVFGVAPRMRFDLVTNIMAMTAWRDHQIIVRGGSQWRPFVHVKQVAATIGEALREEWWPEVRGTTINIGRENMTINDLAKAVSSVAPWAKITRVVEAVDNRDYHVSFKAYQRSILPPGAGPISWFAVDTGARSVIDALRNEEISADDPTTHTLGWYKSLIEWDRRLTDLRLDGTLL